MRVRVRFASAVQCSAVQCDTDRAARSLKGDGLVDEVQQASTSPWHNLWLQAGGY